MLVVDLRHIVKDMRCAVEIFDGFVDEGTATWKHFKEQTKVPACAVENRVVHHAAAGFFKAQNEWHQRRLNPSR